jgi:hypothetical protein
MLIRKNGVICIGIMLVLTAFVGMTANVGATGLPPIAEAGGPYSDFECVSILLDASGSYDPDGTLLTYRWCIDGVWFDNGNNPLLDFIWLDDFSQNILLEVSDGDLTATDVASVTVLNKPPEIISIAGPTEVYVGEQMVLMVNFFDGIVGQRGMVASLDTYTAVFDWGNGISTTIPLGINEFDFIGTYVYDTPGYYLITITIEDDDFGSVTATWLVDVLEDGLLNVVEAGPYGLIYEGSWFNSSGYFMPSVPGPYTSYVYYYDYNTTPELDPKITLLEDATFALSHQYFENGIYTILVSIYNLGADEELGFDDTYVLVRNVPPTIESLSVLPTNPVQLDTPILLSGEFSDPGLNDTHTVTIDWGDGDVPLFMDIYPGTYLIPESSHVYAKTGTYFVTLIVTDDDGGEARAVRQVDVIAPTVDAGPDGNIDEGSWFYSSGILEDIDSFPYSVYADYGDGTEAQQLTLNEGDTFDLSHLYIEDGSYIVFVTAFNEDEELISSDSATVTVNNVAPTALLGNDGPKDEGSLVMVSFSNQFDPGILDTFTYSFDWNNDGIYEISDQTDSSAVNTWYDNGLYTMKGKIKDNDGGFNEYTTTVTINNVPPTIISLSGPPTDPVQLGTPINLYGVFTDPGILDTHSALIEWGDGQTTTINLNAGIYEVSGSHIYANAGVYKIDLTVTDKDGGFDKKSIDYFTVIYDANCGFVTGGGWIIALQGSYRPDPTLTGKATFGFVAKYKKGQSIPTGNTEFQFHPANMNFHSHTYDWLFIVGSVAMYKGSGTINGEGDYGFILTAIDGKISGGADTFRIQIWDKTNGDLIVFDNNENTELSNGQITIHK